MKYISVIIHIEARDKEGVNRLLQQALKDNDGNIPEGMSLHCTNHDPTIPHMDCNIFEEESSAMHDCTDGCD